MEGSALPAPTCGDDRIPDHLLCSPAEAQQLLLEITQIRRDPACQPRVVLDEATVAEYAEAMNYGAQLPPVAVYFDGDHYWLADGFHRCAACETCGTQAVLAEVRKGNRRDAILHSVGVNANHGLRRRNEDKRRAVMTLLEDEEWSKWSDREIARRCAVDHKTVASHREPIWGNSPDSGRRKVSRHGHRYEMDVSKVGRRAAAPLPRAKTTKPSSTASRHKEPTGKTGPLGIVPTFSDEADQWLDNLLRAWNSAPEQVRARFLDLNGLAPVGGLAASKPERATEGESGLAQSVDQDSDRGTGESPPDGVEDPLLPIWLGLKPNTKLWGRQWIELGCPDVPRPEEPITITEALETFRAVARMSNPKRRMHFLEVTRQSPSA